MTGLNGRDYSRFVYVMEAEGTGRFKVGVATNPKKRLAALQTGSPVPLLIVHQRQTTAPIRMEQLVHSLLDEHRIHGEWFATDLA